MRTDDDRAGSRRRAAFGPRVGIALFLAGLGCAKACFRRRLMIGAVAVGIGFEVPSAANLRGYRAELLAQLLAAGSGDVRVHARRGSFIRDADALATRLQRIPGVVEATPVLGAAARADALLARFGLAARADARGHVLSLGEAQRVAVARAVINGPQLGGRSFWRRILGARRNLGPRW
jgi:hypothetical protein